MENLKKDGFALRAGFSLIELLIVITIIGILAVAFLPSITEGPSRARDTQRIADMSDIALALELYYQDTGTFPLPAGRLDATVSGSAATAIQSYFDNNTVPDDPQTGRPTFNDTTTSGFYYYSSCDSGQGYTLVANPENNKTTTNYYTASTITTSTICTPTGWTAPTDTSTAAYYVLHK